MQNVVSIKQIVHMKMWQQQYLHISEYTTSCDYLEQNAVVTTNILAGL